MISVRRDCLQPSELQLVVNGGFPPDEFDSVVSHLDDCDQCRSAIESLERDGDWMRKSLAGEQADPLQAETACQVALWRMMETPLIAANPMDSDSVPQSNLGPYRLLRPLGTGGMGTVYLGEHERLRRKCAIKLLPRERVGQPGWLDRFDREMTTVASMEHPNVVRATDAGHQDGWHYLVMEYLDGLDVGRIASRMGQLEVADACEIVRQAALGLAHVHASGLVHRDVKPSNLMLTHDGVVKLLDLGIVLSGDDPLAVDDRLTTVGHLMGTMPYMAPEQLVDSRDVDPRADIYSLGATLYRLIAGKPPHSRRGGLAQHVMAITHEDPPRLDSVREDVDREVVELVAEMLSRDPDQRPQDVTEVAQRLASIASGNAIKRLLRQALRHPSDAEMPVSRLQTAADLDQPIDNSRRKLVAWGVLGILCLLTGFVFKIATDRGDLIVKSDHDNLVIAIKQGHQVIERLQIESDVENRITLRKGTYIVEIEGATGGLTLDKNVVTIARGEMIPLEVREQTAAPGPTTANQQATGRSGVPSLFRGHPLSHWIEIIRTDTDIDTIGQAMVSAASIADRYVPDGPKETAAAFLFAAREYGGPAADTPPPPNSSGFEITDSEHFMWYFQETFPELSLGGVLEVINRELVEGNANSRAAALYALDLYSWNEINQTVRTVAGRFELSRLLSNCAFLVDDSTESKTWAGAPREQQLWGVERAYQWAIRLALLRDVNPLSLPPVANRFRARDVTDYSLEERVLHYRNNKLHNQDEYRSLLMAIQSGFVPNEMAQFLAGQVQYAFQLKLSEPGGRNGDVYPVPESDDTVQPQSSAEGEIAASAEGLLFQGKDLASWRDLLTREQDPRALGQVMRAVEVLTRGTDQRTQAALDTLRTAQVGRYRLGRHRH